MKHTLYRTLLLVAVCLWSIAGQSQRPRFYSLDEGLQSSYVNSIFIDNDNLVWITTNETVEMFDGLRFHEVNVRNPHTGGFLFTEVHQMLQLDDHRFLLASNNGLHVLDKKTNGLRRLVLSDNEPKTGYAISHLAWDTGHTMIFVGTEGYNTLVLNAATLHTDVERTLAVSRLIPNSFTKMLKVDSKGMVWVAGREGQPVVLDITKNNALDPKAMTLNVTLEAQQLLESSSVVDMAEWAEGGRVYLALSRGGLLVFDRQTNTLRPSLRPNATLFMQSLLMSSEGHLLVGTDNRGLWRMDVHTEELTPLAMSLGNIDMQYAKVHDMKEDADGNLVAALYQHGVLVLPKASASFHYMPLSPHPIESPWAVKRNASCVTSFAQGTNHQLLAGTDGCGLFCINSDGSYAALGTDNQTLLMQSVTLDRTGQIWVGIWHGGLQTLVDGHLQAPAFTAPLMSKDVMRLSYNADKNLLYVLCNGDGIWCVDLTQQTCTRITTNRNKLEWSNNLLCDSEGLLWVADMDTVFFVDQAKKELIEMRDDEGRLVPRSTQIVEDGDQLLVASLHGVYSIDRRTRRASQPEWLRQTKGMNVMALVPTPTHLWLSTNHNIYAVERKTGHMSTFSSFGGNRPGAFHRCAAMLTDMELIVFGADNGLLAFNPQKLLDRAQRVRQVRFTALRLGSNDVVYADSTDSPLDQNILTATRVKMHRGEHALLAFFSAPELADPDRVVYSYQLEGYEKEWHTTTAARPQAYYANLTAGTYKLRVKAAFADRQDNEASEATLTVIVPAQLWATWWAKSIYLLLALLAAWFVWRYYRERRIAHEKLRESQHATETKEAQLRLFTSIAHELRSPLTMVVSPLKDLMAKPNDSETTENYQIMERNCQRMLRVVNQITDVRRIDNGQLRLHFRQVELVPYVASLATAFKGVALARNISLLTESEEDAPKVWLDPINAEKIVINLLNNAMKFTPQGGRVILRVRRRPGQENSLVSEWAELTVYNSGSHIPDDDLERVFERFYQANTVQAQRGSGIGLNLAQEITRLHHGTLKAHNLEPDGVEFVLRLPMGFAHLSDAELEPDKATQAYEIPPLPAPAPENSADENEAETGSENEETKDNGETAPAAEVPTADRATHRTTVLLVDDDKELLDYMSSQLRDEYDISTAGSGNQGWERVLAERPDIVVTDIQMPDGDGFELLRRIKRNPETDLTAVIVLTTENDARNHMQAMELQAEHFLPKPFNAQMLQTALSQVTRLRMQLQQRMRRTQMTTDYDAPTSDDADQRLMKRIRQTIVDHIADSDLNVESLAQEVGMSRVHLNRKLKQLCGISPSAYIRSVRLKQAAWLLATKQVNVSEAAYSVGFSSHSYFSSNFHDFFGMTPKEFVAFYSEADNEEALKKLLE